MKVLTFCHVFPRSEEDTVAPFLWNFHQALTQNGVHVTVVAPHNKGLPMVEQYPNYEVHRFRYAPEKFERLAYRGQMHELVLASLFNKIIFLFYLLAAFAKAFSLIRRLKPDLVHVHWWIPSGLVMAILSKITKTPYIVTTHGTDVFIVRKFKILRPFARFVFHNAKRVHVNSEYVKEVTLEIIPDENEKIDVVPMPIRESGLPYPTPTFRGNGKILAIGRLIERKGFHVLLEAMSKVPAKFHLTLIGSGPEKERLEQLTRHLGIEDRVRFVDSVLPSRLFDYFKDADMFILPSITDWKGEKEGLGMVLLESIWMGVPVIAARSGGVTDIVIDHQSGLLVPERDAQELANAIVELSNKETFLQLIAGGRAHYEKNYSFASIAKAAVDSYEMACLTRQPNPGRTV